MGEGRHYVIIGNGVAGNSAAAVLRAHNPDDRITIISMGALLFYNRYELPRLFRGEHDWRAYLVNPPSYYEENRITVRRNCEVTAVDPAHRVLVLKHREEVRYDCLLVASGGRGYLPMGLREFTPLLNYFNSYRAAMATAAALPDVGTVVMLGGDILGIDLARNLVAAGYRVRLIPSDELFWPHRIEAERFPALLAALAKMGIEVVEGGAIERIEEGPSPAPARRVVMADDRTYDGDVVMPFYGLAPALEFISGSGVDIERGLLVNPELHTTDPHIWAAGDVCQIWCPEEHGYRFYYGWKNVKAMGEIAARNMTGSTETFQTFRDETLSIRDDGTLHSSFWEYE
jgi:NAD(P)H-nitrite reductase large subunit